MKVWVIMENDYPAGVRLSSEAAGSLVQERKDYWETQNKGERFAPRVYVRAIEFDAK